MRRVGWLAAAMVCTLAPACSDDDAGDDGSGSTTSTSIVVESREGPVAIGTFSLAGAVQAEGPFEIIYSRDEEQLASCGSIAAPEADSFVVPVPTAIGDQRLAWQAAVRDYAGPGTYGLGELEVLAVDVRTTPEAARVRYESGEGSTATLEVGEGNAGTFTFAGLRDETGAELSGHFEWSCTTR